MPSTRPSRSTATPSRRIAATPLPTSTDPNPTATQQADREASIDTPELPEYIPAEFPLDDASLEELSTLTAPRRDRGKDLSAKRLWEAVGKAILFLTESAGDINECLTEREHAVKRARKAQEVRQRGGGEGAAEDGEEMVDSAEVEEQLVKDEETLAALRERTKNMTQRLDMKLREAIDFRNSLNDIAAAMDSVTSAAKAASNPNQTQRTARSQDSSTPNPTVGTNAGPSSARHPEPLPQLPTLFSDTLSASESAYDARSLPDRYASDNDYANFKAMVHYASHLGDAPPVPHARTWFASTPAAGVTLPSNADRDTGANDNADSDGEDIELIRERISTKCPLTLRDFIDPVMSTKCPHSFERAAILALIDEVRLPARVAGQPAPRKTVECPVSGCTQILGKVDLTVDPVTVRRIKRVLEAERAEERGGAEEDGMEIDQDVDEGDDDETESEVEEEERTGQEQGTPSRAKVKDERSVPS